MKSIRTIITVSLLALTFISLRAQTPMAFTLKEAQDYAYKNNYDLRNSTTDVEIARKLVKQNTAIGLPQIDAGMDYIHYFLIPTTLIPGEFVNQPGTYFPVQFGTDYNVTARAKATQLVYSGQYLVGVQAAKAYLDTQKERNIKDKLDVRDNVAEAYIGYLIIGESVKILDSTYKSMETMVKEAREFYKNGLLEDVEVDQLGLNLSNLEAMMISTKNQQVIAYAYLKFLMGIKETQEITLTDSLPTFLAAVDQDYLMNKQFDYNHNIDYIILKKQEKLVNLQYKLSKTAYQPSLVAFVNFATNAQRTTWNFFNTEEPWYSSGNWGMSLVVPIWSSGSRKYAVDQARLQLDKVKVADEKLRTQLNLQSETLKNDFNNAYLVYQNKNAGLATSYKIYTKTTIKYKQGISSSTDLNQKYAQFLNAESDYTQAMFNLLKARIRLAKLLEQL